MKMTWSRVGVILLIPPAMAWASPPLAPRIMVQSESPALHIKNARIDSRDGKIRGTAYLNVGYSAPSLPHVHVYALAGSGKIVYESCDKLSRDLLTRSPRLHKGRDSFSASLPADLNGIATIRVVASSGHDDCTLDDNRIFRMFNF